MRLTLLVSDLIPPTDFLSAQLFPALPALQNLLALAPVKVVAGRFFEEACLQELGLRHLQSNPIAPLRLLGDGGQPGDSLWVCADPVHLKVSRDHAQLHEATALNLALDEAEALVTTLNDYLSAENLRIETGSASNWYMQIPFGENPAGEPLWRINGQSVFEHLPSDNGGQIKWRKLQNELQMLLFEHPVNQAREARGALPANGIWFWGGGTFRKIVPPSVPNPAHMLKPANPKHAIGAQTLKRPERKDPIELVLSDNALAKGLAIHHEIAVGHFPGLFDLMRGNTLNALVICTAASEALRSHDPQKWLSVVNAMERDWWQPLEKALAIRLVTDLRLILPSESRTLMVDIKPLKAWQFWRRMPWLQRPLSGYR